MKKIFSIAIAVLAVTLTLSSCKNDTLTDGQLRENIAANKTYKGEFKFQDQKYDCYMVFIKDATTGIYTYAVSTDPVMYTDAGVWDVVNGNLKMDSLEDPEISYAGAITKSGDKLNIESGTIVFDMEKYTPKK